MNDRQEVLRSLMGAESVPNGLQSQYAVDGAIPQVVVMPRTREEVASLVKWAHGATAALIPWGGATSMSTGNAPKKYDAAVNLRNLDRLVEHTPEDMTVTVEAGMTLGELQRRLGAHGQFLPVEAPEQATIGGIIASNRYGSSRLAWGMVRDWLIGIRFVRGDGKLVHGGGKVVKNVAGYDLCKLLVGSYGTLGIIVEATFKVAPIPQATYIGITSSADLARINASPVRPQFVEWVNSAACQTLGIQPIGEETLLVGLSGTPEEVPWQAEKLGARQIEFSPSTLVSIGSKEEVSLRIVGLLSQAQLLYKEVLDSFGSASVVAMHANLCVVRCALPISPALASVIQRLRSQYQVVVERAPVKLKTSCDVWGDPGPSLALMKKVKQTLDPHGILNPGRFVGGI